MFSNTTWDHHSEGESGNVLVFQTGPAGSKECHLLVRSFFRADWDDPVGPKEVRALSRRIRDDTD